jgi:hypothetical protein
VKIGYLRLGNEVELDLWNGSPTNSGCEQRLGIFQSLINRGHKIKIYSKLKETDKPVLEGRSNFKPEGSPIAFDYSWCKDNITYHFGEKPDCDVMWLENGSDNTIFCFGKTYKESYFYHTCSVLSEFQGKCVYHQHGEMPFPFGEQFNEVSPNVSDSNQRKILHELDVQKDKDWLIITPAEDTEAFRQYYNSNRRKYGDLHLKIMNVPLCYDKNCYPLLPVKEKPQYPLLYVGMERDGNRTKKLIKFYSNHDFKSTVIGRWKKREGKNIDYLGQQGKFWETYNFLNDSYASVQIADKAFEKLGMPTARIFQTVFSGAVLLMDAEIRCMDKYVDRDYRVFESHDVAIKVKEVMNMSLQEREEVREKQLSKFKTWDSVNWDEVLR